MRRRRQREINKKDREEKNKMQKEEVLKRRGR